MMREFLNLFWVVAACLPLSFCYFRRVYFLLDRKLARARACVYLNPVKFLGRPFVFAFLSHVMASPLIRMVNYACD